MWRQVAARAHAISKRGAGEAVGGREWAVCCGNKQVAPDKHGVWPTQLQAVKGLVTTAIIICKSTIREAVRPLDFDWKIRSWSFFNLTLPHVGVSHVNRLASKSPFEKFSKWVELLHFSTFSVQAAAEPALLQRRAIRRLT